MEVYRDGRRIDYRPVQHNLTPTNTYVVFTEDGKRLLTKPWVADYAMFITSRKTSYQWACDTAYRLNGEVAALVWPKA